MSCRAAVGLHHQIPIRILGKTASERERERQRERETETETDRDRLLTERGGEKDRQTDL